MYDCFQMLYPVNSFLDFSMPPRKSSRPKRRAVTMHYPGEHARKQPRRLETIPEADAAEGSSAAVEERGREAVARESEMPQLSLHPDVIAQLSQSISRAIIDGLKDNVVMQHAQVTEMPIVHNDNIEVESAVQGSVTGALNSLTGEAGMNTHVDKPGTRFNSVSIPIGARVSEKIKTKIWAHEYFDFGLLLNNTPADHSYQLAMSSNSGNNTPMLSLEPKVKPRRINTIEQWTSAFQIFVGIYTNRFQTSAPVLMKYGEIVRDLAARGGSWRYYDENFRYLMQEQHGTLSWGEVHWELWLRAQHAQVNKSLSQGNSSSAARSSASAPAMPRGYCWRFHKGQFCGGCAFKHECFRCGAKHPASKCSFRTLPTKPASISFAPGSQSTNPSKSK